MNACGCRVELAGQHDYERALAGHPPSHLEMMGRPESRIVYCSTHEAAFRLAGTLTDLLYKIGRNNVPIDAATPDGMNVTAVLGAGDVKPLLALLREIGR